MALHNLEVFQNELAVSNVHTTIIRKDNSNLSMIDNGFRLHLYGTYPYETMFTQLKQYVKPNTILQIIDNFNFMYYMVFVPSHCLNEEDSPYFIIGPFLNLKLPAEDIHGILKENQVPEHLLTIIFPALLSMYPKSLCCIELNWLCTLQILRIFFFN